MRQGSPHPPFFYLFLLAAIGAGLAPVKAQDEFNPLGRNIPIEDFDKELRIRFEWIEMSQGEFAKLMAEPDPATPKIHQSSNDGPLRAKVEELIKEQKARIIDASFLMAKSGMRAKVESIRELIYATEYDGASLKLPSKPNDSDKDAAPTEPREDAEEKRAANTSKDSDEEPLLLLPNPVAFETRNVGTTVEVDPQIGPDGLTIDLNMSPEIVYHVGDESWGKYESEHGKVELKMPTFYSMRLTTAVTMFAGEYCFVGVQSPPGPDGKPDLEKKVMIFVKADLLSVGLPVN